MVSITENSSKNLPERCDLNAEKSAGAEISPILFENIKIFTAQEQRFDSLKTAIFGKLSQLSKRIILDTKEWQDMDLEAKCTLIAEIQECFYDLQLVEHASQMPVLALAKAVFSLNKKRCIHKAPSAKAKPSKKQKLENILTRQICRSDCERKSPSVLKAANHDDSHHTNHDESINLNTSIGSVKKHATGKRRSNRYEKSQTSTVSRSENGMSCDEKSLRNGDAMDSQKSNTKTEGESSGSKIENLSAESASTENVNNEINHDEPPSSSNHLVDSLPRRRAAALAAAVSVAETVNPQRSASPRKRNAAGISLLSNYVDDDNGKGASSGAQPANSDEPTYCLCEQVSFGDMICCDYTKCSIEWFHFSCVNIKIKPKGKKWFCPLCRGEKPTVLKASLQAKR